MYCAEESEREYRKEYMRDLNFRIKENYRKVVECDKSNLYEYDKDEWSPAKYRMKRIMYNNFFKYINDYFNTFNNKDYTIYVNGIPIEWYMLQTHGDYVVWNIPSNSNEIDWYTIHGHEIEAIRLTTTTMEIVKTNGKEYTFTAKTKRKEEKAKNIILKTKNAICARHIDDALKYLDELKVLMDE